MEESIIRACEAKVTSISNLPLSLPNIESDHSNEHLRVSILPVPSEQLRLCSSGSKHQWILQVSVYVRSGDGSIKSSKHVQSLKEGMPFNSTLSHGNYEFHVAKKGDVSQALVKDGWYIVPVSFRIVIFK